MRSSLAAQRDELQDLRGEMAQLGSTVGGLLGSAGKALAQIRNEKEELERHNAMLKASLAARWATYSDWPASIDRGCFSRTRPLLPSAHRNTHLPQERRLPRAFRTWIAP